MLKQKIELLSGDAQKHALEFAAYLQANNMQADGEHGEITHKGKTLAYMHIDGKPELPGPWTIWPQGDFSHVPDGFAFDDTMKEIAWANVNVCGSCGSNCAPGSRQTVFGKEFDNLCGSVLAFNNPDADSLVCVKKLFEMKALL